MKQFNLKKKQAQSMCAAMRCKNAATHDVSHIGYCFCDRHYDMLTPDERGETSNVEAVRRTLSEAPQSSAAPLDPITAELAEQEAEAKEGAGQLETIDIQTPEVAAMFDELLQDAHTKIKMLEAKRKEMKAPSLEAGRKVDELFKPAINAFETLKRQIKTKIQDWYDRQAAEQRAALAEGTPEAALASLPPETTNHTGVQKRWRWEVENENLVPRKFWTIDAALIEAEARRVGHANVSIPGIRFWCREEVVMKRGVK